MTSQIGEITNQQEFYRLLNLDKNTLTSSQKKFLNDEGYLILPPPSYIKKNLKILNDICDDLILKEGNKGGWEGKEKNDGYGKNLPFEAGTNRLGNLIEKHEIFKNLLLIPEIISIAREVIRFDIKLSGFTLRNPLKNHGYQQFHIDGLPRKKNDEPFHGVLCAIFLDDANNDNGSTRIIPKSHKKTGYPDEYIDPTKIQKDEIRANLSAGSILAVNLNTWHAGAKNLNGKPRKSIFMQIKRRDETQLLNYKKYLKKETISQLSEQLKYYLAVREEDPTQDEISVGPQAEYRKKYGNKERIK